MLGRLCCILAKRVSHLSLHKSMTARLALMHSALGGPARFNCAAVQRTHYAPPIDILSWRCCCKIRVTAARAAGTAPAAGKDKLPTAADPSRILFVGGIPARVQADVLEHQLGCICAAAGCPPTKVQVIPFESEAQRKRFATGWLHKGFALLAFQERSSVDAAAAAIRAGAPGWGGTATLGPARTAPDGWAADLTYTQEELAAYQEQQAALEIRRAHNRRQRRRQSQRLVDSVDQLLSSLQQPFGTTAESIYQPLMGQEAAGHLAAAAAARMRPSDTPLNSSSSNTMVKPYQGAADTAAAVLPPRLQQCMRWPAVLDLLQRQQQCREFIGPIQLAAAASVAQVEQQLLLDWSKIPLELDPAFGGRLADADVVRAGKGRMNLRALRKRVQVESFALLLWQITQGQAANSTSSCGSSDDRPLHVVEFGSGSGNLVLALAHLFPQMAFTAVDMKPSATQLLQQRVEAAGLHNVSVQLGRIEAYSGPADVVLALHACGSATDWALLQAAARNAAFIVSPCCIGKINRHSTSQPGSDSNSSSDSDGESESNNIASQAQQRGHTLQQQQQQPRLRFPDANKGLQYPRSQQLQQQMCTVALQVQQELPDHGQNQAQPEHPAVLNRLQETVLSSQGCQQEQGRGLFSILAATADYSHQDQHSHPHLAGLAKTNVELDRGMCMIEAGYQVALVRLLQPELTAKSDVLVGVHCAEAAQCRLPWMGVAPFHS